MLRCIVDARRTNWRFATPPGVELCTAEGLARIEVELPDGVHPESDAAMELYRDLELSLGMADVSDAFHRFKLCRAFSKFFGVGHATAAELGIIGFALDGQGLTAQQEVDLLWNALPMGFSWSLYFCQAIREAKLLRVPSLHNTQRLTDRGPPAVVAAADSTPGARSHYLYVDNMGVLGARRMAVEDSLAETAAAFDDDGLATHEAEVTALDAIAVGVNVNLLKHRVSLSQKRYWRVRQALRFALRCRRLPGHIWEVLIGHATYCGLVERGSLSAFHAIYAFIHKQYYTAASLWLSAARRFVPSWVSCPCSAAAGAVPGSRWSLPLMPALLATECVGPTGAVRPSLLPDE